MQIQPVSTIAEAERAHRAAGSGSKPDPAVESARNFEAFFMTQMFEYMGRGLKTEAPFGGGSAEQTWRSMLNDEYGKAMSRGRGIGIADMVYGEMLRMQEQAGPTTSALKGPASIALANMN